MSILASSILVPLLGGFALITIGLVAFAYRRQSARLRKLQQSLAESQDHFRLVFEHSGVGMALLTPEGRFLQANPALVQLFGYDAEELTGRRLVDLAHPDEVGKGSSSTELGLRVPSNLYERERRYRRKDGREVWARVLRVPLREAVEQLRYIVAVILDITERRRAERARTAAEERFRQERDFLSQVLETADALIFVLDDCGRVLRFNRKCLTLSGRKEDEIRGGVFWDLLVPERGRQAVRDGFVQVLREHAPTGVEIPLVSVSGEARLISWRFAATKGGPGQPSCVIAAGLDLTDQKSLEEQLRHAQKMETLGTLVGGIAHDFNNQLAIILGNLRLVLSDMTPDSPGRSELLDADQAGQRCADMTRTLLTFGQRRVGRLGPVDLNDLVIESVRLLERVMPANIAIKTVTEPELASVHADRTQLHQVLMNLAVNARDAMPDGGVLTLATSNTVVEAKDCVGKIDWRPGRYAVLAAADTGTGMTPEVLERIFEPFFTTKKMGHGSGLGLAMVFGIVKAHRGWVHVESTPNEGSVFRVYLPAAVVTKADSALLTPPALVRGGHERILVVDDEQLVRKVARSILERWGFQVLTAASGDDALEQYREHGRQIDLVLLDLAMPGLNGMQVLEQLKQLNPEVRVIFASGHTRDSDCAQLLREGALAFVAKPYRAEELVAKIRQALDETQGEDVEKNSRDSGSNLSAVTCSIETALR